MVGWHHWVSGHEFEQTLGDGEGQGSLACCRGVAESDMTQQQQQLLCYVLLASAVQCHESATCPHTPLRPEPPAFSHPTHLGHLERWAELPVCESLSRVQLLEIAWTLSGDPMAPLSMRFLRQEYWSGLPFLSPGDFSDVGIEPQVLCIAGTFFTIWVTGSSLCYADFH